MPISNLTAPCNKELRFLRKNFLQPPDWRWQEAKKLVLQKTAKISITYKIDTFVLFAARLQEAFLDPSVRSFIKEKMPDAWQAVLLGISTEDTKLKALLEACIIYGLTPKQIHLKLKWCSLSVVMLYRDLFCDLSGIDGAAAWFLQMMLLPLRKKDSMTLFRARALAYYHSLDAALKNIRFGNSSKACKLVMLKMWRALRAKQIFDYFAKLTKKPILTYVTSMLQAIAGRLQRDFIKESKELVELSLTLLEVGRILLNSIRGFTLAEAKNSSENAKAGIDFTTKYIEHIKAQG